MRKMVFGIFALVAVSAIQAQEPYLETWITDEDFLVGTWEAETFYMDGSLDGTELDALAFWDEGPGVTWVFDRWGNGTWQWPSGEPDDIRWGKCPPGSVYTEDRSNGGDASCFYLMRNINGEEIFSVLHFYAVSEDLLFSVEITGPVRMYSFFRRVPD